ncbi:MAG: acetoacetate--CoA ligase [Gemmatimonadaceae bacterium]|nr:acetoacetate--CoA ligase [Gemmatimonadaceae bacterium]
MTVDAPIWRPSAARIAAARVTRWRQALIAQGVVPADVGDMHAFWRWSVAHPERFWREWVRECDLLADAVDGTDPFAPVLTNGARMEPPTHTSGPRWFPNARLSFAEHLLRWDDDRLAIVAWTEQGRTLTLTHAALRDAVGRAQRAFLACGVQPGDRVVGFLPNIAEAVVAMLAATALGATWSSCSPDFGVRGVLDRFAQIGPVVLVTADGYAYAGKVIDLRARIGEIAAALPTLRATLVVPHLERVGGARGALPVAPAAQWWTDALAGPPKAPACVRVPFDHPLYVLYSSGTTGLPKGIVHGVGGTLVQHLKELVLHTDLTRDDVLFYFTTCGWMMWNWLVSALAVGSTIVLFDGAPLAPRAEQLWDLAQSEGVTVFGTSAKYLALLEKAGVAPRRTHELSRLRALLSTGSPLAAHSYDYVSQAIGPDVQVASISGGTDIVSCFALGDPTGAVYRGELQTRGLGMAVDVVDDAGHPVRGAPGELVCTAPFPSMPVAFWNDPDGARYRAAYFEQLPGVWRHGVIIHGRSDATLNPGGVRIGTAEIYRQVEQIDEVLESLVVEQTLGETGGTDARIVLFVRLRTGVSLDDALRERIRRRIREHTSPHHVPRIIEAVADIPRTVSGKITELAVREVIHGRPVKNIEALANPEALALFRDLPALRVP